MPVDRTVDDCIASRYEGAVLTFDYPLISLFLLMCWFFFVFAFFFGVIWAFIDNFRCHDRSVWRKAGWACYVGARPATADANQ